MCSMSRPRVSILLVAFAWRKGFVSFKLPYMMILGFSAASYRTTDLGLPGVAGRAHSLLRQRSDRRVAAIRLLHSEAPL